MRTLLGGLILTCLMLLTGCAPTEKYDTWLITCDDGLWVEPRRFAGHIDFGDGGGVLKLSPHGTHRVYEHVNAVGCTVQFLGRVSEEMIK